MIRAISHVVNREAERHSCAILSRQGKGGAIRDRPRISGKTVTRKAVGEGEGKMKIESREQFLNSRHTHERQFLCHDHFSSCVQSAVESSLSFNWRAHSLAGRVFKYAIATGRAERDPQTSSRCFQPREPH